MLLTGWSTQWPLGTRFLQLLFLCFSFPPYFILPKNCSICPQLLKPAMNNSSHLHLSYILEFDRWFHIVVDPPKLMYEAENVKLSACDDALSTNFDITVIKPVICEIRSSQGWPNWFLIERFWWSVYLYLKWSNLSLTLGLSEADLVYLSLRWTQILCLCLDHGEI